METKEKQTLGEKRVKINFNPSTFTIVDEIKTKSAELIDLCETLRVIDNDGVLSDCSEEKHGVISLAQRGYEGACMWAVKANFTD